MQLVCVQVANACVHENEVHMRGASVCMWLVCVNMSYLYMHVCHMCSIYRSVWPACVQAVARKHRQAAGVCEHVISR